MNARQQAKAAYRASLKAQRAAKEESERIEQEQRSEPLPIKLELDGANTTHHQRSIRPQPE